MAMKREAKRAFANVIYNSYTGEYFVSANNLRILKNFEQGHIQRASLMLIYISIN